MWAVNLETAGAEHEAWRHFWPSQGDLTFSVKWTHAAARREEASAVRSAFISRGNMKSHLEKQNPAVTVKLFVWLWDDDPTRDEWTMLTYHKNTKLSSASLFHVCTAAWRHVSSRWCLQIVPPKYVMDDTVVGWTARADKLCVALLWLANVLTAKSLILLTVFCHSGERMFETKSSMFVCSSFVHADIRSVNLK